MGSKSKAVQTVDTSSTSSPPQGLRSFFSKIIPLALYGGFASIVLLYYTDTHETSVEGGMAGNPAPDSNKRIKFLAKRAATGAVLYPVSRVIINYMYYFMTSQHFQNDVLLSGFTGLLCGMIFGSRGLSPDPVVGALSFSAGAMIIEYL